MTTVRDAFFDVLRQHGTTTIFANPGSTEIPLLTDLPADIEFVLCLHEGSVVGAATGWAIGRGKPADSMIAEYDRACEVSREIASGFGLDDAAPHPRLGHVSLRWVYVHLIEETARHAGHADILREQTDGATGFDG